MRHSLPTVPWTGRRIEMCLSKWSNYLRCSRLPADATGLASSFWLLIVPSLFWRLSALRSPSIWPSLPVFLVFGLYLSRINSCLSSLRFPSSCLSVPVLLSLGSRLSDPRCLSLWYLVSVFRLRCILPPPASLFLRCGLVIAFCAVIISISACRRQRIYGTSFDNVFVESIFCDKRSGKSRYVR